MKKIRNITRYLLVPGLVMALSLTLIAQGPPPPPPPPDGHGISGNQPPSGGNAPIGNGIFILMAAGAIWGAGKTYLNRNKQENEM